MDDLINKKLRASLETGFIDKSVGSLDLACDEVRSLSHQMMPRALIELGLTSAIDDMLNKSLNFTSIKHEFEHIGVEDRQLEKRVEIALYRICQELINNVVKHSGATKVSVQLYRTSDSAMLLVEDDGAGFKPNSEDGIGMHNINSRASAINGKVSFEDGPTTGTVAQVRIPLKKV